MKKYITMLVVSLIGYVSVAEDLPRYFSTVDDLIANVKQVDPTNVSYDTNGFIVGVVLPPGYSTDRNLHLLSQTKSVRYLLICSGPISTNTISALAEYPNLTGLGLVCCGGRSHHLVSELPFLTNLQSLELSQTTYRTNDAIYLAKMTNLMALKIAGSIPTTRAELLALTNLVNLRKLVFYGRDEYVNKVDTNIFSRLDKLTNFVVTSAIDNSAVIEGVWKTPIVK